jgi:bifunctional ADP-heptose synthase (sugar kinase/adenylyltransferase)
MSKKNKGEANKTSDSVITYRPDGLRTDYNTMVNPGTPDGNDPKNPVVVYADGVFDMYHVGHAKVLE